MNPNVVICTSCETRRHFAWWTTCVVCTYRDNKDQAK